MANRYEHKESPYSSHSLLLGMLPSNGKGQKLLDVGCWDGKVSAQYLERSFSVTGIERSRHANLAKGIELVVADLNYGLPELTSKFDYVVCADVLEHLLDPLKILRSLRAQMAVDGKLLASLPNSGHWYFRLMVLLGRFPKEPNGLFDATHLHFFTWDGWVELFREAGFLVERVGPSSIPFSLILPNVHPGITIAVGEHLHYWLGRLWMRMFAYQFVVTFKIN